jgi:hypothetical protein
LIQGLLGKARTIASIAASFALIRKFMGAPNNACRKKFLIDNIWTACGAYCRLFMS